MFKRIIIVGTDIKIKKVNYNNIEFIRVRKNQSFKYNKTDLVICFEVSLNFGKSSVAIFSEKEVAGDFFISSIKPVEENKDIIPLMLSLIFE